MHYSNMLHLMIHIAVDGVSNPYAMCVWKCFSLPSAAKKDKSNTTLVSL